MEKPSGEAVQPNKGTNFLRTCFDGLNTISRVGMLSIPYALSQGNWQSLFLLIMVSVLCCYTGLLIQCCMGAHPSVKAYPDICDLAFGRTGRAFVSVFIYLELYLVEVEFLILEGDNHEKLFLGLNFDLGGLTINRKQGFILLAAFVIRPTTWLRRMGALAYVSNSGCLDSVVLIGCVLCVTVDRIGFHERGVG